jgi:response regulator of citrate/malate metabolism
MAFFLNNKLARILLVVVLLTSACKDNKTDQEEVVSGPKEYIMYQPSEMANFMNALYAYNEGIKSQIENGEIPTQMPLDLMTMHTAEMTKGKHRSEAWQNVVDVFIESQKQVTDSLSSEDLKLRYNAAINNCLSCHKTECTGPIPRIKKLLIQ